MRVFVAASLSCFVALAAFVAIVMWREPALHRADPHPVIYPGHEPGVMRFIEPLAHHGFAGLKVRGVQIHGASIRVQMRSIGEAVAPCVLPSWAQAPGALQITLLPQSANTTPHTEGSAWRASQRGLSLEWAVCGPEPAVLAASGNAVLRELADRDRDDVWGDSGTALDLAHPSFGILTPALRVTGISHRQFAAAWFLFASLITVAIVAFASRAHSRLVSADPIAAPRASRILKGISITVLIALSIGGASTRFDAARHVPRDGDEVWAQPSSHPILFDDHDAWVHPPVFRTVQQFWSHRLQWQPSQGIAPLRTPSVWFAILALCVVAFGIAYAGSFPLAAAPIALLAFSPGIISSAILARPYALATLIISVLTVSLWCLPDRETRVQWSLRTTLIVLCAGLAMWVDVIAGLAALGLIAMQLLSSVMRRQQPASWIHSVVLLAALIWCAPVLAGASSASTDHSDPTAGSHIGADMRAGTNAGRPAAPRESASVFARHLGGFTWLGDRAASASAIALAATIAFLAFALARDRRSLEHAATLALLMLAIVLISTRVSMRDRNVLFVPHMALLAVALAIDRVWQRWNPTNRAAAAGSK